MTSDQKNADKVSIARQLVVRQYDHTLIGNFNCDDLDARATAQVFDYYMDVQVSHQRAKTFLKSRGLDSPEALSQFQIGFSDRTLGLHLSKLPEEDEMATRGALQRVGLLKPSGHEFFRGSMVFPFVDDMGKIVGAYGRRVTPKLKANSVYHVHWLTVSTTFFNGKALKESDEVIVCKNPIEALSWWIHGFKNVVALMGAQAFTSEHIDQLIEKKVSKILIAFGNSREEQIFSRKIAIRNSRVGIQTYFLLFPQGMDTNAFITATTNPKKKLLKVYNNPFLLSSHKDGY